LKKRERREVTHQHPVEELRIRADHIQEGHLVEERCRNQVEDSHQKDNQVSCFVYADYNMLVVVVTMVFTVCCLLVLMKSSVGTKNRKLKIAPLYQRDTADFNNIKYCPFDI